MRRFFGMMPSDCIEISKTYKNNIIIDAGKEGWTIIYADNSTQYKDIEATAEENFKMAYEVASQHFNLEEDNSDCVCEEIMCYEE